MTSDTQHPQMYNDEIDELLENYTKAPVPSKEAIDKFILCRDNRCETKPGSHNQQCRDVNWTQLIPVRYAITEHYPQYKYLMSRDYEPVTGRFRPVGLRLFDHGYLYYVHSKFPKELHEMEMNLSEEGFEMRRRNGGGYKRGVGYSRRIDVPDCGILHVYYCDHRLSQHLRKLFLEDMDYRLKICQVVNLDSNKDLLPINANEAENEIAECRAARRESGLFTRLFTYSAGKLRSAMPTDDEEAPYFWDEEFKPCSFTSLTNQILNKYNPKSYFLMVDDPVGIMDDLTAANIKVLQRDLAFKEEHGVKYDASEFIASVIDISPRQIRLQAMMAAADADAKDAGKAKPKKSIDQISDAKLEELIKRKEKLDAGPTKETRATGSHREGTHDDPHKRAVGQLDKELEELGLKETFDAIFARRQALAKGSKTMEQGVAELINEKEMRDWRAKYLPRIQTINDELLAIDEARCLMSKAYDAKIYGYDSSDLKVKAFWSGKLARWQSGLGMLAGEKAQEHNFNYFVESLGMQNILTHVKLFAYKKSDMDVIFVAMKEYAASVIHGSANAIKDYELEQMENARNLEREIAEKKAERTRLEETRRAENLQRQKTGIDTTQAQINQLNAEIASKQAELKSVNDGLELERQRIARVDQSIEQRNTAISANETNLEITRTHLSELAEQHRMRKVELKASDYQKGQAASLAMLKRVEAVMDRTSSLRHATPVALRVFNMPQFDGFRALMLFEMADMVSSGNITAAQLTEAFGLNEDTIKMINRLSNSQRETRRRFNSLINPSENTWFRRWQAKDAQCRQLIQTINQGLASPDGAAQAVFKNGSLSYENVRSLDEVVEATRGLLRRYDELIAEVERAGSVHETTRTSFIETKREIAGLKAGLPALEAQKQAYLRDLGVLEGQIAAHEKSLADLQKASSDYSVELLNQTSNVLDDLPQELRVKIADGAAVSAVLNNEINMRMSAAATAAASGFAINDRISISQRQFNRQAAIRAGTIPGALAVFSAVITILDFRKYLEVRDTDESFQALASFASSVFSTLAASTALVEAGWKAGLNLVKTEAMLHKGVTKVVKVDGWFTGIAGVFAATAVVIAAVGHGKALKSNWNKNNTNSEIGAGISLIGDVVQLIGIYRSVKYAREAVSWFQMLLLGARYSNLIIMAGILVAEIGMAIYNYFQRTPLQLWAENCVWGAKAKNWDRETQSAQLAQVLCAPRVSAKEYWSTYTYDNYDRPKPDELYGVDFRLEFQDLWSQAKPEIGEIRISGRHKGDVYPIRDYTLDLSYDNPGSLAIALRINDKVFLGKAHGLRATYIDVDVKLKHPAHGLLYEPYGLRYELELGSNTTKVQKQERTLTALDADEDIQYRVGSFEKLDYSLMEKKARG